MIGMLVLSRKVGESILLELPDGRVITIMVTRLGTSTVRIGIDSDRAINIIRKELQDAGSNASPDLSPRASNPAHTSHT